MDRIAIMGAGALGTILGAYISRTRQVDLFNRNKVHVDALNKHGARLTGSEEMTVPVKAFTLDEMEGAYDLFIYLAKQTANDTAIPLMLKHSHENTILCTGQNGLPEEAIVKFWDPHKVFGAPAGWGGAMLEPGVVETHNLPGKREFVLGAVDGEITPALLEVKKILELLCHVEITQNLTGHRWAKLTGNATFSGMSTVMDRDFGDVAADPRGVRCAIRIGRECIRVAKAAGVKIEPFGSLDFANLYDYNTGEEEDRLVIYTQEYRKGSKSRASMLNDFRRGYKNVEIDAINGTVCGNGRKYGIATPYNDRVVEIVKNICTGKINVSYQNINFFDDLLGKRL